LDTICSTTFSVALRAVRLQPTEPAVSELVHVHPEDAIAGLAGEFQRFLSGRDDVMLGIMSVPRGVHGQQNGPVHGPSFEGSAPRR
jgi:hypothetical protein